MFFKISRMVLESRRTRLLRHLNCQLLLYLFIATVCYVNINTLKDRMKGKPIELEGKNNKFEKRKK